MQKTQIEKSLVSKKHSPIFRTPCPCMVTPVSVTSVILFGVTRVTVRVITFVMVLVVTRVRCDALERQILQTSAIKIVYIYIYITDSVLPESAIYRKIQWFGRHLCDKKTAC